MEALQFPFLLLFVGLQDLAKEETLLADNIQILEERVKSEDNFIGCTPSKGRIFVIFSLRKRDEEGEEVMECCFVGCFRGGCHFLERYIAKGTFSGAFETDSSLLNSHPLSQSFKSSDLLSFLAILNNWTWYFQRCFQLRKWKSCQLGVSNIKFPSSCNIFAKQSYLHFHFQMFLQYILKCLS